VDDNENKDLGMEDAADLDPAELARRFDALEENFRKAQTTPVSEEDFFRAHGAPADVPAAPVNAVPESTNRPTFIIGETTAGIAGETEQPAPQAEAPQVAPVDAAPEGANRPTFIFNETAGEAGEQPTPLAETPQTETAGEAEPPVPQEDTPATLDGLFAIGGAAAGTDSEGGAAAGPGPGEKSEIPAEPDGTDSRRSSNGGDMTKSSQRNSRNGRSGSGSRRRRKTKKRESLAAKIVKWAVSVVVIIVIAAGIIGGVYVYGIVKDTPRYDPNDIEATLKVMSTIYDDQGTPMKNIYLPDGQRTLATFDQFPDHLVNAIVAIEDKTFWTHKGFNIVRIFGAILESVRGGGDIAGTSTITQQLARNIWLFDERSDRTIDRKIREAVYARELETNLSKEEILTIYLNTIALGNHSYGIVAAAENYFGKRVEDLTLIESAALAALPKAPSQYAMIITVSPGEVSPDDPRILLTGTQYVYLYNDAIEPRIALVLSEMLSQGYITKDEYDAAKADNIRSHLVPKEIEASSNSDFFVSYAITQIADDLLKYDKTIASRDEAIQKIYSGGLDIYTTFNQRDQDIATEEFNDPANYPYTRLTQTDDWGNIVDENKNIVLYSYDNMFETHDDGSTWFRLVSDGTKVPYAWSKGKIENEERRDFAWQDDGSLLVFSGAFKRLGIYNTDGAGGPEIVVEFKDFYTKPEGVLYMTKGGQIPIPKDYKGMDSNGNLIISAKYFDSGDSIFTKDDATGDLLIDSSKFTLRQSVVQPQGAFALIEHHTGQLKAVIGGRDIEGQFQFDRSQSPRQPGSTIKPIAVYGPAIDMSANGERVGGNIPTYGQYWSPASIIIDEQMTYKGKVWPKNWYSGYKGPETMRYSIEQSINVNAVKTQLAIGDQRSVAFLQKLGISTLVLEQVNGSSDLAPGALALGGMTKGIKPFELASAYGSFANAGVHVSPIAYTLVKDKHGNVILDGTPTQEQVMDPGTAFIMNDMLTTTVQRGLATAAKVPGVTVAGKTGTTSDHYDAWFVGNTPKYAAVVWIGCDVQVELSEGSSAAAKLYSKVMTRITDGEDQGQFPPQPANVVSATVSSRSSNPDNVKTFTDYFIAGTVPDYVDMGVEEVEICSDTGYLATPWCPHREIKSFSTLPQPEDSDITTEQAPTYYCYLHNLDPATYPPNPDELFNYDFGKTTVPDLTNLTLGQTMSALEASNLKVGEIFTYPQGAFTPTTTDIVVSQNPAPGSMLPEGSVVNITVQQAVAPPAPPPVDPGTDPGTDPTDPGATGVLAFGSSQPPLSGVQTLFSSNQPLLSSGQSPLRSIVASYNSFALSHSDMIWGMTLYRSPTIP